MGLEICCEEFHYRCAYSRWHIIRADIILATYEYLKTEIFKVTKDENNNDYTYQKELELFFNKIDGEEVLDLFLQNINPNILNILIFYNLGGLYSLCNKSDDDGYYSVGNSYDICELIHLVKYYFIKITSEDNISSINAIEEIFKESFKKKLKVCIW